MVKDEKESTKKSKLEKKQGTTLAPTDFDTLRNTVNDLEKKFKAAAEQPLPSVDAKSAAIEDIQKEIVRLRGEIKDLKTRVNDDAKEHRDESRILVTGVLWAAVIALFLMILTVTIFAASVFVQDKEAVNNCEQATKAMEDKFDNLRDYCAEVKAGAIMTTSVTTSTTTSATETKIGP